MQNVFEGSPLKRRRRRGLEVALKRQVSSSPKRLLFHCVSLSGMQDAWDLVTLLEAPLDARSLIAVRDEITNSMISAVKGASVAFICQ